jgi:predicted O-linked N-acetylglucosamine transferase (SPINDLY family)
MENTTPNPRDVVRDPSAEDLFEKAVWLQTNERPVEALSYYQQALDAAPEMVEACFNMGLIYFGLKQWQRSIVQFKKALDLKPDFPQAAFNLASALKACGQYELAVSIYRMALDMNPDQAEAYYCLGICHLNLKAPREAVNAMRRAVALEPANALFWFHLAEAYLSINDIENALAGYRNAIQLRPDWAAAHYNMAVAFRLAERIDRAIDHLKYAVRIDPGYAKAYPLMFRLAQHACDWPLAVSVSKRLDELTRSELDRGAKSTEPPMTSIRRHADVQRNMRIACSWSHHILQQAEKVYPRPNFTRQAKAGGRIRLGYLSSDYKDHAVAHQIRGIFENHDRRQFEVFGYACNPDDGTPYRQKLAGACDHFREVHFLSNFAVARQIHEDGIHILIDMSGHSRDNRLAVAALRPAPVQVSYLGFLSTTGAPFIDYVIADPLVVPDQHAVFYTEKVAYLPHCYQANDDRMPIERRQYGKSHWHLPDEAFVFCSFNQPYKIDANLFQTWMAILKRVDHSVLWLVERSPVAKEKLQRAAGKADVDPERLVFAGFVPLEQNLARLQLADLVLDTLIYNGGATTSNALWAGVPVLTTLGNHWVSRMSASALHAIGLPELIARDVEDYGAKAVELALNPPKLSAVRERLRHQRLTAPLFDTPLFTRHMEKAFIHMWHRQVNGLAPASFKVQP